MKKYYDGRQEKTIRKSHGHYRLEVRYLADGNKAQVTMYDLSELRFPLLWSETLTDEQAHSAEDIFSAVGYFNIASMEG